MQAFLFGVRVAADQVQVVRWLLASSGSQTTPGGSVSDPSGCGRPSPSPTRVLAPMWCHHTIPGDPESFGMVGPEPNLASLQNVAVGQGGGHRSLSLSHAWHKTQGMGERGYPGKSLGRLPVTSRFHFFPCFYLFR